MNMQEKDLYGIWVAGSEGCNTCNQYDTKVVLLSDPSITHPNWDCTILPITTDYAKLLLVDSKDSLMPLKPIDGDMELLFTEVEDLAKKMKKRAKVTGLYQSYISINKNNMYLKREIVEMLAICVEFITYVNIGQEYDIKSQEWYKEKYGDYQIMYDEGKLRDDEPGNMLYGYFGAALGLPIGLLVLAGGIAQIKDGNSIANFRDFESFGDDPVDTNAIKRGFEIYKQRKNIKFPFWRERFKY